MLPPTTDALKLHIERANYQAGIWIRADVAIMDTEVRPVDTNAWQDGTDGLEVVWKRLPTVPDACIEHVVDVKPSVNLSAVNASKHY